MPYLSTKVVNHSMQSLFTKIYFDQYSRSNDGIEHGSESWDLSNLLYSLYLRQTAARVDFDGFPAVIPALFHGGREIWVILFDFGAVVVYRELVILPSGQN